MKTKLYFYKCNDNLMLFNSYNRNSGFDTVIKNKKACLSNIHKDNSYNGIVNDIVKFYHAKPIRVGNDSKLYKIPFYNKLGCCFDGRNLDIWGGDIKPDSYLYIVIYKGSYTLLNIFDSFKEAEYWVKD